MSARQKKRRHQASGERGRAGSMEARTTKAGAAMGARGDVVTQAGQAEVSAAVGHAHGIALPPAAAPGRKRRFGPTTRGSLFRKDV